MSDLEQYEAALSRAAKWLAAQQNADGSVEPAEAGLACYHKVPYALSLAGEIAAAARLLDWVRDNDMREMGELGARHDPLPPYDECWATPIAWVVCGAQRTGQFDIASLGARFLVSQEDADGRFGSLEETAWAGLALVETGEIQAARRAGDRLARALPSVAEACGPAGTFLVRLCRATREPTHLAAARAVVGAAGDASQPPSGAEGAEIGRAAALLFGMTGDSDYEQVALAVADELIGRQREDGSWRPSGEEEQHRIVDFTAELAVCLAEIVEGLAIGQRG